MFRFNRFCVFLTIIVLCNVSLSGMDQSQMDQDQQSPAASPDYSAWAGIDPTDIEKFASHSSDIMLALVEQKAETQPQPMPNQGQDNPLATVTPDEGVDDLPQQPPQKRRKVQQKKQLQKQLQLLLQQNQSQMEPIPVLAGPNLDADIQLQPKPIQAQQKPEAAAMQAGVPEISSIDTQQTTDERSTTTPKFNDPMLLELNELGLEIKNFNELLIFGAQMIVDKKVAELAPKYGGEQVIACALKNGADPNYFYKKQATALTTLLSGFRTLDPECIKLLLRYGANPNKTSSRGGYPLQMALKYHTTEIAQILLDAAANPWIMVRINIKSEKPISLLNFIEAKPQKNERKITNQQEKIFLIRAWMEKHNRDFYAKDLKQIQASLKQENPEISKWM